MAKYFLFLMIAAILLVQISESKPYQMLKTREGEIPVYIRYGDQPLAEINPDLAEAFGEAHEISARNIKSETEDTHAKFEIPFLTEFGDAATAVGKAAGKAIGSIPELIPGVTTGNRGSSNNSESSNKN